MQQLIINLTDDQHALMLKKAGNQDLEQITRCALDQYFNRYVHTAEPLPPLDLTGRGEMLRKLATPEIDPRKPLPPDRGEVTLDGRKIYETDEDWAKVVGAYEWQLKRYEAEKSQFEEKRRNGTINEWGGISFQN